MSTEIRHYGEFVPLTELAARRPNLRIRCNAADLLKHWRRCGLSSDFGARYLSRFFVSRKVSKEGYTREAAEGTLSGDGASRAFSVASLDQLRESVLKGLVRQAVLLNGHDPISGAV